MAPLIPAPLSFVVNAGQTDPSIHLYGQGNGFRVGFLSDQVLYAFSNARDGRRRGAVVTMRFLNARPGLKPTAAVQRAGKVNYLIGLDPSRWHRNLPTYGEVVYRDVWPGIDVIFRGADGKLKYEFVVQPGARVPDIRLAYAGASSVSLDDDGRLRLQTAVGLLIDDRPFTYQENGATKVPVTSGYRLRSGGQYGFEVGSYDAGKPLIIDPALSYSTYLGGVGHEEGHGVTVDASGNAYVTGVTTSADFPTTPGSFDPTYLVNDAFITKLDATGSTLVYSTYLGGSGSDVGATIAVDATGHAHVAGYTGSTDFPTTAYAFDTTFNGRDDVFVVRLDPTGSALVYSTYLGGSSDDYGWRMVLAPGGSVYLTGWTTSPNFPVSAAAFDTTLGGRQDAFVVKLDPAVPGALTYATYLGGSGEDRGMAVDVDSLGQAYVTGGTSSSDFPTTPAAFDTTYSGGDAFVTKFNPSGSAPLVYSTYLGGAGAEEGRGIAVDSSGSAYVAGDTGSADYPTTPGAFDTSFNGGTDAFVTKLTATGSAPLLYSTFLGGAGEDHSWELAIDAAGDASLAGYTSSSDFPTMPGAFDPTYNGGTDAFVTKLNASGSAPLVYSTFLGGTSVDQSHGFAVDEAGHGYVTGRTSSADYPTTAASFDRTFNGEWDAFVTRLDLAGAPPAAICGNSQVEAGEQCDQGSLTNGTPGSCCSATCTFKSVADVCRPAADVCDEVEQCTGSSAACPADTLKSAETVCRPDAGACDRTEFCTGSSRACPADAYEETGTACRSAAGACDVAETCAGNSAACPGDRFASEATACDDGLFCTVGDHCAGTDAVTCIGAERDCDDGNSCSTDVCNEADDTCDHASVIPPCEGKLTGGGQVVIAVAGEESTVTFGFSVEGKALVPPDAPGGPRGHFNYRNHANGLHINGSVAAVDYAVATPGGGEMKFEVVTREGCRYRVTARDQAQPGSRPPFDHLALEYVSGPCLPETTGGPRPLARGNLQWHDE
jgi:hypothetical protein